MSTRQETKIYEWAIFIQSDPPAPIQALQRMADVGSPAEILVAISWEPELGPLTKLSHSQIPDPSNHEIINIYCFQAAKFQGNLTSIEN